MTRTFKSAPAAVFWFFVGHISRVVPHNLHEIMRV
jgi:hypothetical protein